MEATLSPYQPTWRDQIAQWMLGDQRPTAGQRSFVSGLLGSAGTGSTGISVVDATPIGGLLGAQEAAQRGDAKGVAMAAVVPGPLFRGARLPAVANIARAADKFVYHSGVASDLEHMQPSLYPQHGGWVQELAQHSADDADEFLDQAVPLVWMSDRPSWVHMKVARKLGKHPSAVTDAEVAQHGHVALVPRKSDDAENVWHVGQDGLSEGPYSPVTNLRTGETTKAYNTDIFQHPAEPFGVERNEYVSANSVDPMFHLTGDDLVEFLRLAGQKNPAGLLSK